MFEERKWPLKSFLLHRKPQHRQLPRAIKPVYLLAGSWGVQQGKCFDMNNKFALQILKIKRFFWFFLLAIRGLLPALGNTHFCILKHVDITSQAGKNKAMQNHCSCRGMESPVHSPKATGLSKIYNFCLTHLREDSSHFLPLLELFFDYRARITLAESTSKTSFVQIPILQFVTGKLGSF